MSVYGTREKELKSVGENESSVAHMKAWSNIPENLKSGMSGKASAGSTFEFWQKNYIYLPFSPILISPGVNKIGYLIFCKTLPLSNDRFISNFTAMQNAKESALLGLSFSSGALSKAEVLLSTYFCEILILYGIFLPISTLA